MFILGKLLGFCSINFSTFNSSYILNILLNLSCTVLKSVEFLKSRILINSLSAVFNGTPSLDCSIMVILSDTDKSDSFETKSEICFVISSDVTIYSKIAPTS